MDKKLFMDRIMDKKIFMDHIKEITDYCWSKAREAGDDRRKAEQLCSLKIIDAETRDRIVAYYLSVGLPWRARAEAAEKVWNYLGITDNADVAEEMGFSCDPITDQDKDKADEAYWFWFNADSGLI